MELHRVTRRFRWAFGFRYRRPPVNPWRFIATRQKHFYLAATRADCKAIDQEFIGHDIAVDQKWEPSHLIHDRSHMWCEAAKNCTWGVE